MTSPAPRLVLASGSPRRLDLLRAAGLEPSVRPADLDEAPHAGEDPVATVARLARAKAAAVAAAEPGPRRAQRADRPRRAQRADPVVVLGADTTVVVDGEGIGKPVDAAHAEAILARLAGRAHTVSTGVAVVDDGGEVAVEVVTTIVEVVPLSPAAVRAYVATGEPFGKAGAYAIQGRAGAFVRRLRGSYTNVVGLPLAETLHLLRAAGVPTPLG